MGSFTWSHALKLEQSNSCLKDYYCSWIPKQLNSLLSIFLSDYHNILGHMLKSAIFVSLFWYGCSREIDFYQNFNSEQEQVSLMRPIYIEQMHFGTGPSGCTPNSTGGFNFECS